jgi:hypothetical protein
VPLRLAVEVALEGAIASIELTAGFAVVATRADADPVGQETKKAAKRAGGISGRERGGRVTYG